MVTDALVDEVRARADIVEICGEHVSLKRVGKSYRGPCPLHGGEGRNFSVDPERGIFKCFVCGEGGDVFGFLMKQLGLDFPSAVRQVAARVGIEVPDRDTPREDPHAHLREVAAFAEEWFAEQLLGSPGGAARSYLEGRGIGMEAAERYALGFAPNEWRGLRDAARTRGIDERHLMELGLVATSERAEEPYDRFRNRLTFAIRDLRDRPIGFGGRLLEEAREEVPKYINSPDSPIFHKGRELYGLNWARHSIRREGFAAIVEGYTDVLSLHLADLPVAVAGLGTAFTDQQAQRIARYTQLAYLLYDSDAPGLKATFRAADILLTVGVHPLVITLPPGQDPDSLVRAKGVETLRGYLDDAVDVLERKLQILERQGYLEKVEGRRRAIDGLLSTLRAVRDPALRDIYLDRTAERTGVRRETLVHEIARADRARTRAPPAPAAARAPRETARAPSLGTRAERDLILLLLRDPPLARRASAGGVRPEHFSGEDHRAIFTHLLETIQATEGDAEDWLLHLPESPRATAEALLRDETELTSPAEIFDASVRRLLYRRQRERLTEIDRELELADPDQQRDLLVEKERIADRLREVGEATSFMPHRSSERRQNPESGRP
jgi:DNA primase